MANTNLKEAKAAKNDEFYTQFHDIEIEMNAYLEYDPDVFRGKIVLLPCDDHFIKLPPIVRTFEKNPYICK